MLEELSGRVSLCVFGYWEICLFEMGVTCRDRICYLTISALLLLLLLLILTSTQMRFLSEGRPISKGDQTVWEEQAILRAQIGSRPPRCERRCSSCGHCEAIQVPANPQVKSGNRYSSKLFFVAYAREGDNSNYKPLSWKCKCGDSIFNP